MDRKPALPIRSQASPVLLAACNPVMSCMHRNGAVMTGHDEMTGHVKMTANQHTPCASWQEGILPGMSSDSQAW